jgi:L-alanine-DL-glutamate epimerase-like enolase superfamily enzyme
LGVPAPSNNRITSLIEWSSSESATPERSKRGITLLCGAHGATLKGANAADAALPANFIAFELPTDDPAWWFEIVDGLPDPLVERGSIEVWDRPGMGVELNPEKAGPYLREEDAAFFG